MDDESEGLAAPTGSAALDARLVADYLAGDRSALGAIYDRHGASLFDTAAAMTGNRDDAADMVQDVFVLAAERLAQLRDPTRLRPWLFAILRNEVYRRSRRRSRSVVTDFSAPAGELMMPTSPAESDVVDDEIDATELAELIRSAARGLDARDQLVLELSVRQGLSGNDLADALGVSAQQGYGLVHRMRERTERSLGAYCVARRGRRDCDELAGILQGWDGEFTVLLRKRVARHIESCDTCERTRRKVLPLALVGSAPAFAAPIGLRDQIMERVLAMPSGQAPGVDQTAGVDASTGFPVLEGVTRIGRRLGAVLGGVAAATLIVIGGLTIGRGGDGTGTAAPDATPAATAASAALGSDQQPSTPLADTTAATGDEDTPPTDSAVPIEPTVDGHGSTGASEAPTTVSSSRSSVVTTAPSRTTTDTPEVVAPAGGASAADTLSTTAADAPTTTAASTPSATVAPPATSTTAAPAEPTPVTTTAPPTTSTTVANRAPAAGVSVRACSYRRSDMPTGLGEYVFTVQAKVSDPDGDRLRVWTALYTDGSYTRNAVTPLAGGEIDGLWILVDGSGTATFTVATASTSRDLELRWLINDGRGGNVLPVPILGLDTSTCY